MELKLNIFQTADVVTKNKKKKTAVTLVTVLLAIIPLIKFDVIDLHLHHVTCLYLSCNSFISPLCAVFIAVYFFVAHCAATFTPFPVELHYTSIHCSLITLQLSSGRCLCKSKQKNRLLRFTSQSNQSGVKASFLGYLNYIYNKNKGALVM